MAGVEKPAAAPEKSPKYKEWGATLINEVFGNEDAVFAGHEDLDFTNRIVHGLYGKELTIGERVISYMDNPANTNKSYLYSSIIVKGFVEQVQKSPAKKENLIKLIESSAEEPVFQNHLKKLLGYVEGRENIEVIDPTAGPEKSGVAVDQAAPEGVAPPVDKPDAAPNKPGEEAKKPEKTKEVPKFDEWGDKFMTPVFGDDKEFRDKLVKDLYGEEKVGKVNPGEIILKWMHDPEAANKSFSDPDKKLVKAYIENLKKSDEKKGKLKDLIESSTDDDDFKKSLQNLMDHVDGKKDTFKGKDKRDKATSALKARLKDLSMGELFKALLESLKNLAGSFKDMIANRGKKKPALSKKNINERKIDFSRAKNEKFTSENRDVEYVAKVLGDKFPAQPNAQSFLEFLESPSEVSLKTKQDINELKVGDVLFFHDGKDKEKADLTAIVSQTEPPPPKMQYVGKKDEKPKEVSIEKSELYKSKWLGSIRLPEAKKEEEKKDDDNKPEAKPETKPGDTPPKTPDRKTDEKPKQKDATEEEQPVPPKDDKKAD